MRCPLFIKGVVMAMVITACRRDAVPDRKTAASVEPGRLFTEITQSVGIDFIHETGMVHGFFYPEIMGSGVAVLDYDNDGDLDIYFVNGALRGNGQGERGTARNRLYERLPDGSYRDATSPSGLGDTGYGMGCAVGDIDNDGNVDLYVTNYGVNALYRNQGDGTFRNRTASAGVGDDRWGSSACFLDYDRDGFLDLFVVNYLNYDPNKNCEDASGEPDYCGPQEFEGVADVLYHNNGDGTFGNVSHESGIGRTVGKGLGVLCRDLNGDNLPDVLVANDGEANVLWINRGDGTFVDRAVQSGLAVNARGRTEAGMGVAGGDVDGDGRPDVLMTHLWRESNTLYLNIGSGRFEDRTAESGLANLSVSFTGFGTSLFDYDNDGDLDALVVNGRVFHDDPLPGAKLDLYWNFYAEPNLLFENTGGGRFVDASGRSGGLCGSVEVSRGLVTADLDGDGGLDVVVTNGAGHGRVYENAVGNRGNWLAVRAVDPRLSRDAIGAIVTVTAGGGSQRREITRSYSYLSSGTAEAHFGLSNADRADSIMVRWPDGLVEQFPSTEANHRVSLIRGQGRGRKSR